MFYFIITTNCILFVDIRLTSLYKSNSQDRIKQHSLALFVLCLDGARLLSEESVQTDEKKWTEVGEAVFLFI